MKRIGYAKLGRSIPFDPRHYGMSGNAEAPQLLMRLARRNPDVEWVLVGKHKPLPHGAPPNIVDPWPPRMQQGRLDLLSKLLRATKFSDVVPTTEQISKKYACPFCLAPLGEQPCCARSKELEEAEECMVDQISQLDGVVVHVGQHGSVHSYGIPKATHTWAEAVRNPDLTVTPQLWAVNYGGYLLRGLAALGDRTDGKAPVSWIVTDPRNYLKARDIKWPSGTDRILAQHTYSRYMRHERFRDARTPAELGFTADVERDGEIWKVKHSYRHAGLELMILPDDWESWGVRDYEERAPIGVASTAVWAPEAMYRRSWMVKTYVLDQFPDAKVYGEWDEKSLNDVDGRVVQNAPSEFTDLLGSWRVTLVLPPSARGTDDVQWTTAKPFQAFAARTAALFIGKLDWQGWIIPTPAQSEVAKYEVADGLWSCRQDWTENDIHLARWLRTDSPETFARHARALASSKEAWTFVVDAQRDLLRRRWEQQYTERIIEHQQEIR